MNRIRNACALVFSLWVVHSAVGQPDRSPYKGATVDELKNTYLSCTAAAVSGRLPSGAVMQCSIVYEELKWRAFGGDFEKLHAWSRAVPVRGREPR